MTLDELEAQFYKSKNNVSNVFGEVDSSMNKASNLIQETNRMIGVAHYSDVIIKNLDGEFEFITKLRGKDIGFLFFATALQCVRQYFLTDFKERLGDQEAAKKTKGHYEEHSNRKHRLYNPSLEEIISNPVPFDTTFGAPSLGSDIAKHGGHRFTTLGHDPILGWIFGTANIATSTLTDYKFVSYHILTGENKVGNKLDKLSKYADTQKVMSYSFDKLFKEGSEGKLKISTSLIKEAIHLKSDISTTHSLPIPVVSTFNPKLASAMAEYGLDMANVITVAKQATIAHGINLLIAMIHRMTYNEEKDGDRNLFEVRTRRILTYSNVIASASNVIAVAIGSIVGLSTNDPIKIKKSISKLDIGGLAITLLRLIKDYKFIQQIKEEFIMNEFEKIVIGE